ncbi:AMP-binding protein [Micromonospora sp. DT178]|uniref:AMP-binding protein n=1 Tax=Micromonospora sp. DT178 TaxID=3393436 RepID=UPI003CEF5E4F
MTPSINGQVTSNPHPAEGILCGLLAAQAARTPQVAAVVSETTSLSYAELDVRANRPAQYLKMRGARPQRLVAVAMERSAEQTVAVLEVLRAGAALPARSTWPVPPITSRSRSATPLPLSSSSCGPWPRPCPANWWS